MDVLRDMSFLFLYMFILLLPVATQTGSVAGQHPALVLAVAPSYITILAITFVSHVIASKACGREVFDLIFLFPLQLMLLSGMSVNQVGESRFVYCLCYTASL